MNSKHIFLISGVLILILVVISWFVFPAWSNTPGGLWLLLAATVVGVVPVVKFVIDILQAGRKQDGRSNGKRQPGGTSLNSIFQFGSRNKVKVGQHGAKVSGAMQAGEGNEILVSQAAPKRTKRS